MRYLPSTRLILAVGLLVSALSLARGQLILNGDFESPALGSSLNFSGTTAPISFTGWTGVSAGNGGNSGLVVGTDFGLSPQSGGQHFSFNGINPDPGTYIEQAFSTVSGQTYEVTFWVGRNNGNFGQVLTLQTQVFGAGNGLLASSTASPPAAVGYSISTLTFVADSASTALRFTDASGSNPNTDLFLDTVAVTAIPEPASVAIACGLAVLAAAVARRKSNTPVSSCQKACFRSILLHLRSCHRDFPTEQKNCSVRGSE